MATLHAALDSGIAFFDTADVYGDGLSERLIGRLHRERQEPFGIATKACRLLSPHTAKESLANGTSSTLTRLMSGREPGVAAALRALKGKLLPHPRHQLGPGNPGGVVRAGLVVVRGTLTPALSPRQRERGCGIALLPDVADRQRRDGRPQRVVRCKHPVIELAAGKQAAPVSGSVPVTAVRPGPCRLCLRRRAQAKLPQAAKETGFSTVATLRGSRYDFLFQMLIRPSCPRELPPDR